MIMSALWLGNTAESREQEICQGSCLPCGLVAYPRPEIRKYRYSFTDGLEVCSNTSATATTTVRAQQTLMKLDIRACGGSPQCITQSPIHRSHYPCSLSEDKFWTLIDSVVVCVVQQRTSALCILSIGQTRHSCVDCGESIHSHVCNLGIKHLPEESRGERWQK